MALLPPMDDQLTLSAIDRILEQQTNSEPKRRYIGASSIGDACARKLWYRFHSDHKEIFKADTIRKFNSGHRAEDVMAAHLRLVPGVELITHRPDGSQYGFKDGDFSGHYDGMILGLLEAPKTWHVWEHKEVNEKKFAELKKLKAAHEKSALQLWDPVYYAQAITYMYYEEVPRHFLTVSTPGLREYTSVRTDANNKLAEGLRMKAKRIAAAQEPPERIGGKDFYLCKWCAFYGVCHA